MFFDNFSVEERVGLAMWFTLRSAVEKLYSDHPVTSNILSSNEIILIHTKALSRFLAGAVLQQPFDERLRQYEEVIHFIESVTAPF